jgi:hypothetical protein
LTICRRWSAGRCEIPIGGIISGLGSAVGGLFGASAAGDAAKAQSQAAQNAIDLQRSEFAQTTQNLLPFLQGGYGALQPLLQLILSGQPGPFGNSFELPISSMVGAPPSPTDPSLQSEFLQSPGYQYNLGQQQNAIQNSAAGRTGAISGNMLKALQTNASGLASQDWTNFYNNLNTNYQTRYGDIANQRSTVLSILQNLISGGQAAAAQQGQFGQQSVSNIGSLLGTQGSANAAGILGSSNALTNALSGLTNNSGFTNAISTLFGGGNTGNSFTAAGGGGTGSAADNQAFNTFFPVSG